MEYVNKHIEIDTELVILVAMCSNGLFINIF